MSLAPTERRHAPATRAFTLIEILVVVVILGIAAAIVVPAIGSRDDLKATSAARMIMADLIYAQNRAISQQKKHYVRFDPAAETYEVLDAISPAKLITHPVEVSPFLVKLGSAGPGPIRDVLIDVADFDGKTILMFDELGTPYAYDAGTSTEAALTNGQIRLVCRQLTLTITVEPFSGELRIN
jgi:prepilin-type N-terminal cleavage/methylation domain-containing protein